MAGAKGKSGGRREGAGRPPCEDEKPDTENPYEPERDPLDFLIQVMNNPLEDRTLRVRAAITAAQYMHTKKGDSGKKDSQQDAAERVAGGRFARSTPPRLIVSGGKRI